MNRSKVFSTENNQAFIKKTNLFLSISVCVAALMLGGYAHAVTATSGNSEAGKSTSTKVNASDESGEPTPGATMVNAPSNNTDATSANSTASSNENNSSRTTQSETSGNK